MSGYRSFQSKATYVDHIIRNFNLESSFMSLWKRCNNLIIWSAVAECLLPFSGSKWDIPELVSL
jgi:hypothetical protein